MTHAYQFMTIRNSILMMVARSACEALFYGCFTVLFAVSIYLMFHTRRRGTGVNKPILIVTGLLYLSCSVHFALNFSYCSQALLVIYANVFTFPNETTFKIGLDLLISVTPFFGELILIYRCWLLWSRNYWVIILPSLISFATIVCTGVFLRLQLDPKSRMNHIMGIPTFSLPLGTNVVVTTLMAGRIWYLSPHDAQFPTRTGQAALKIVVESGMLNLAVQLIFVILFAIGHPAQGIVGVIAVQTYGISATLIIIRASLCASDTIQSGSIRNGPPSFVVQPTSSEQVHIETILFTEPACRLPAEKPVSEINSKPSSEF